MSSRAFRTLAVLLILVGAVALQAGPHPAAAQTPTTENDDSCIACHEALYLNHDTGKWYCMCEVKARCTFCHGGVLGETTEEEAHAGMVANPVQHGTETCEGCHPQDVADRVVTFASRAGFSATPCPTVEALAASLAPTPATVMPTGLGTVQIGALLLLGAGFIVLSVFAHRCWKADCLRKRTQA
jgi:nitrate/TMAO reductase-like tetraheme cytochrome c subunit